MNFKCTQALQDLVNTKEPMMLMDKADSTCTSGYDNDGATGYEIFENGFNLAIQAKGQDVWCFEIAEVGSMVFFIGTEEQVTKRIKKIEDAKAGGNQDSEEEDEE